MSFANELYADLKTLVNENKGIFISKTIKLDELTYEMFNYTMATFADFQKKSALYCRGIMFDITDKTNVIIVAFPMEKFFNINENESTTGLDLTKVVAIYEKLDGSLISAFMHYGKLRIKSKYSIDSEQCYQAMEYLNANPAFSDYILKFALNNKTVNMEWISPINRIVVGYKQSQLKIINIRDNITGEYIDDEEYRMNYPEYFVTKINMDPVNIPEFIKSIPDMTEDIEGYVVVFQLDSGDYMRVKIKTAEYHRKHKVHNSILRPGEVVRLIIEQKIDDVRSLFAGDELITNMIIKTEENIRKFVGETMNTVLNFYNQHHTKERKDYVTEAKKLGYDAFVFKVIMTKYTQKDDESVMSTINEHILRNYKLFNHQVIKNDD